MVIKCCGYNCVFFFDLTIFILDSNKDNHNILDEFELQQDATTNSSFSLIPILLNLYRCLNYALKMCMWFGYNPPINFYHFFRNLKLVIYGHFDNESEWTVGTLYLVCETPPTLLFRFFLNFTDTML